MIGNTISNYQARLERAIKHYVASIKEEYQAIMDKYPNNDEIQTISHILEKIMNFNSLFSQLLSDHQLNRSSITSSQFGVNRHSLESICLKIYPQCTPSSLYLNQIKYWETITSNDVLLSQDVNYRLNANSVPNSHHSLLPIPAKISGVDHCDILEYTPFIEATTGHSSHGLNSSLGFLHIVGSEDSKGFQAEFPISMIDSRITCIEPNLIADIIEFDRNIPYNHDLWHHVIPVYAEHFILHHPNAPISLGGLTEAYKRFGSDLRINKEEYELALGIGHRILINESPEQIDDYFKFYETVLNKLKSLKDRCSREGNTELGQDIFDHLSVLYISRIMTIVNIHDKRYTPIDIKLKEMNFRPIIVNMYEVVELLMGQGIIQLSTQKKVSIIENVLGFDTNYRSFDLVDKDFIRAIKQADLNTLQEILQMIDVNAEHRETGSEYIVEACFEMGILEGNSASIELQGIEACRWLVMCMPQRRQLKGYTEKIHNLNEVSFGTNNEKVSPFEIVERMRQALDESVNILKERKIIRDMSQKLCLTISNTVLCKNPLGKKISRLFEYNEVQYKRLINILDMMFQSLYTYEFKRLSQSDIYYFKAAMDCDLIKEEILDLIEEYQYICTKANSYMNIQNVNFQEEREKLEMRVMRIS